MKRLRTHKTKMSKNHYKLYGKRIVSDLTLPHLVVLSEDEKKAPADITIKAGTFPDEYKTEEPCWSKVDKPISILSNYCCYLFIENGNTITYELKKDFGHPEYLTTYILGWGMAMLMWQRGELSIHCSCVANDLGAVLICGNSGGGKSTVTSFLLDNGYRLMADDVAVLELLDDGAYANPAFPAQKFCRDVVEARNLDYDELTYIDEDKDKFLVPYKGPFPTDHVKVRAMVFLAVTDTSEAKITEVRGLDKFMVCLNSFFLKPLFRKTLTSKTNSELALKMASYFPVYVSERPKAGNTKEKVIENIKSVLF